MISERGCIRESIVFDPHPQLFLPLLLILFSEQFNRMDNTLEETNASLSRSERILRGMKSIGGAISQ